MRQGNISVNTENIFPIIKKFLYTDQDIFLRELVSNAVDATRKLDMLIRKGEAERLDFNPQIKIHLDKEAKTLTISDDGLGMNEEEIIKYLSDIAFSSAEEFAEKFKDLDDRAEIIGHFGLGFYSAFMVAEKVTVVSLSYKEESAIQWESEGKTEYTLSEATRDRRGSDIILHISEEGEDYLDEGKIQGLLTTYCKFMPIPIVFGENAVEEGEGEEKTTVTSPRVINNSSPLWTKSPSELKDEDYLSFYRELYPMSEDPLFWIHLNVDYPFHLEGILYFPKLNRSMEVQRNKIGLYSNQVFVTDNVEEIVPEFLTLLHGVIDSTDIPLNVSRSALQADSQVKKITGHISKKVSDKLNELFKKDREGFEKKWEDIGVFVKYGLISDEKFYERSQKIGLLKSTEGVCKTIEEWKEALSEIHKDKNDKLILLYTNNPEGQHTYIESAKSRGYTVLVMDVMIDNHFMQHLEMKDGDITFKRVDADALDSLIDKDENVESVLNEKEVEQLKDAFTSAIANENFQVECKALNPKDYPVTLTQSEWMRRMKEMNQMGGGMAMMGEMPDRYNVVVNTNHPLAQRILKARGKREAIIRQLFDLALLSQGALSGDQLTSFLHRSIEVLED